MSQVVLITGPIGAGKSTVADLVARRFDQAGWPAASVDLDDVVFMQRSAHGDVEWERGRVAHSALTAAWLSAGVRVVVAHGPICTPEERRLFLSSLPADIGFKVALLRVPLDVSISRVLADDSRRPEAGSRVVSFLRKAHAQWQTVIEELAGIATWDFDTTTVSPDAVADAISSAVTADTSEPC